MQFFTLVLLAGATLIVLQVVGNIKAKTLVSIWIPLSVFFVLTLNGLIPNMFNLELGPLNNTVTAALNVKTGQTMKAVCSDESYYDSRSGTCTIISCPNGRYDASTGMCIIENLKLISPTGQELDWKTGIPVQNAALPGQPKGTYACTKIDGVIKYNTCKKVTK